MSKEALGTVLGKLPRALVQSILIAVVGLLLITVVVPLLQGRAVARVGPIVFDPLPESQATSTRLDDLALQIDGLRNVLLTTSRDYFLSRVRDRAEFESVAKFFVEYVKLGGSEHDLSLAIGDCVRTQPSGEGVDIHDFVSGSNFHLFFSNYLYDVLRGKNLPFRYHPHPKKAEEFQKVLQECTRGRSCVLMANDELLNGLENPRPYLAQLATDDPKWAGLNNQYEVSLEDQLRGYVLPFWRSQYVCIYRTDAFTAADAPERTVTSWQAIHSLAVHDPRFAGKIGFVHPNSPYSTGGKRAFYAYMFSWLTEEDRKQLFTGKPLALGLESLNNWTTAVNRLNEFVPRLHPIAGDATFLFEQLRKGEVLLTVYALDYFRFFDDRGFFEDLRGESEFAYQALDWNPTGSDAFLAVTVGADDASRDKALQLVAKLTDDDIQGDLAREMHQFPGIEMWDRLAVAELWSHTPWSAVRDTRIGLKSTDLREYVEKEIGPRIRRMPS